MMKSSVYLNGRFSGFHDDGDKLVNELRSRRRNGELHHHVNVAFYKRTNEVFINTDGGRATRPLVVVKSSKSFYTPELKAKIEANELSWNDLVQKGIIEYLDAEEEENANVAQSEAEITGHHTHVEIDPIGILGYASAQVPFPEYNMAPRVLMAAQHTKQALGLYASNFNLRSDTRGHVLFYPQKPLVQTRTYRILGNDKRPSGQNFIVAVLSFKGFNMNDAVVLSRSSIERALGRSVFLRTYTTEERRYPGGQRDRLEIPQEFVQGYMGPEAYANLGEDGITTPETFVNGDSVLVGKTSPPRFLKEISALDMDTEKRRESSITVRSNETGIVDAVLMSQTTAGNRYVKVRVRDLCVPEIGDKFASRFGQKGVISITLRQEDMPFTREGIVPDLIINPHAIPGRMTAGHLLEMLGAKSAAMSGEIRDGTAFTGEKEEMFEQELLKYGFRSSGEETLYDGSTGRMMAAKIFIAPIYYQRLHHLVKLKMHARSRGPVQMLTHQPTEGRARVGGLRLGEMERDCFIGYGSALLLRERMIDSSDKTVQLIDEDSGDTGYFDRIRKRRVARLSDSGNLKEVEMSYAFKLLLDEIKSIGIFPKLKLTDKV
ncbi:DNA-directed RNA polymerase subunit B [Candidatus Micrarchaeota archaeon CG1_02_55_22]|nr:MAG: DNA-directed RNA polymerase subunit B [Candidatus Micrarchaeota archaeon CG1_02_55_22]